MEKLMVTHRLSLDMSNQAVQATITLAQYDTATHRLIVSLRNGAEVVELPPGSYAVAVQDSDINSDSKIDVLDSVTVYGPEGVYPNCIVYDVSEAVTGTEGYHEAQFLVTFVGEDGALRQLASPRIAFVIKPDIMRKSDIENSQPYAAVVQALAKVKEACSVRSIEVQEDGKLLFTFFDGQTAITDKNVKGVGVSSVVLTNEKGLDFTMSDGTHLYTESVQGPEGEKGDPGEDYVLTEADKTEIVESVLASLPIAEEASF